MKILLENSGSVCTDPVVKCNNDVLLKKPDNLVYLINWQSMVSTACQRPVCVSYTDIKS